jgi:hypothetical protein
VVDRVGHNLQREVSGASAATHPAGTVGDDNYEAALDTVNGKAVPRRPTGRCG